MTLNFYAQVKVFGTDVRQKGRFYLHNDGIEAYGLDPLKSARKEFKIVTDFLVDHGKIYPWVIGILWGRESSKVVDLFVYTDVINLNWASNPSVNNARFIDGVMQEKVDGLTCGDGLIVLGREEDYRRKTRGLEDYLFSPPRFSNADIKLNDIR